MENTEDYGLQVRKLYKKLPKREQIFLGAPPFSSEINREIDNYRTYIEGHLEKRKRISLGFCLLDSNSNVLGYQATTIIDNANATEYEKEFLKLEKINYAQMKKILVDPAFWGKMISDELLINSLELATKFHKKWVTDVNSQNERMTRFLAKHGIKDKEEWKTKKGTLMYRFSKGY